MKSYDLLFGEPFTKSQEIDDTFVKLANEKGLKEAINYLKQMGATTLDIDNFDIMYCINQFTDDNNSPEKKESFIKSISDLKEYVKKVQIVNNDKLNLPQVIIETIEGTIKATQFSSINPNIKEVIPCIDTSERLGKCYYLAYMICLNLGIPNNIVTGYTYGYTDKSQYLHSWIETELKGEPVVIDGTLNVIMNKEGYYKMRHIEVLTKISNETLMSDIEKYLSKVGKISLDVYYLFRDEIIEEFKKNETLFTTQKH